MSNINFVSHGGNHQVAIVFCPAICKRFLHLSMDGTAGGGWRLRDFATQTQLGSDNADVKLSRDDIEKEVWLSLDDTRVLNVEFHDEAWGKYLKQLSHAFINSPEFDTKPGKNDADKNLWKPF